MVVGANGCLLVGFARETAADTLVQDQGRTETRQGDRQGETKDTLAGAKAGRKDTERDVTGR